MFQFEIEDPTDNPDTVSAGDQSTLSTPQFAINDHVVVEKSTGTVRYVGPVGIHAGVWVGIEWDDPTRGKHDGTVDGVRYFDCGSPSASFVRPPKVQKTKKLGEAFQERYGHDENLGSLVKLRDTKLEDLKIEFRDLKILDLSGMNINEMENPENLGEQCPKLEYLNLADNLVQNWSEIVALCRLFTKLQRLDVSANCMKTESVSPAHGFPTLEHLILGNNNYDWDDVVRVSSMLPKLANLQLQYNAISSISTIPDILRNLKQLDLTRNRLSAWGEVLKLSELKSLEYLNLSGNLLKEIFFPATRTDSGDETSFFPKIVRLNLSENCISDWSSVYQLDKLGQLRELRLELNPLLEKDSKADNRAHIIAKVRKLVKLEGAEISGREKRDAEIDFGKRIGQDNNSEPIISGCENFPQTGPFQPQPRLPGQDLELPPGSQVVSDKYRAIFQQLGAALAGSESSEAWDVPVPPPPVARGSRIQFLTLEITPEDPTLSSMKKEFQPDVTVLQLRMQLNRMYKKDKKILPKLQVVSHRNPSVRYELDNNYSTLHQLSVENSDKVIVSWPQSAAASASGTFGK